IVINQMIGRKLQSMVRKVLIGAEIFPALKRRPILKFFGIVQKGHIKIMYPYLFVPFQQIIYHPLISLAIPAGSISIRTVLSPDNGFGIPEIVVFNKGKSRLVG